MPPLQRRWHAPPLWRSFGFAMRGIAQVFRTERNFQIHVGAMLLVNLAAWWRGCTAFEWAVLWLAMGLVLVAEMLNTALEYAIDLLHPDHHPAAGAVKDIAAGAVLVAATVAVIVAVCILGIPLIRWMVP